MLINCTVMLFKDLLKQNKFLDKKLKLRADDIVNRISFFLSSNDKILDIGCGTCHVAKGLTEKGYKVVSLDVKDSGFFSSIKPIVYDGRVMPFSDKEFDTAILICLLHHTPYPEEILKEAGRVAKKLVVMEDIYTNILNKYFTFAIDSVLNFEFIGHPHTNKTDEEWKRIFTDLGFKLEKTEYHTSHMFLRHATYYLSA